MSTLTKYDQDNYPEMLGRICIINAPMVFKAIWQLVKPLLNPRTLSKIQVRGCDPCHPSNQMLLWLPACQRLAYQTERQASNAAGGRKERSAVWPHLCCGHTSSLCDPWHAQAASLGCRCSKVALAAPTQVHWAILTNTALADPHVLRHVACRSANLTTRRTCWSGLMQTVCLSGWVVAARARCWMTSAPGATLMCCAGWRGSSMWQPRPSSASALQCQRCRAQRGSCWCWTTSSQTATTHPGGVMGMAAWPCWVVAPAGLLGHAVGQSTCQHHVGRSCASIVDHWRVHLQQRCVSSCCWHRPLVH